MTTAWKCVDTDIAILRDLAKRQLEIALSDVNADRRRRWLLHNALKGEGPMILAEIGGLHQSGEWDLRPQLRCEQEWARSVEHTLRWTIYHFEQIGDDAVVEPYYNVGWQVSCSDYGIPVRKTHGGVDGHMGSYTWDPPLKDLSRDIDLLHPRTFSVDRESTLDWQRRLNDLIGDILPVRIRGGFWWTTGLSWMGIDLVGLDRLMLLMYDDPDGLHRLMRFLHDDMLAQMLWCEREGLLTLNNESDYIGSGSQGHSDELPQPDWRPGMPVRLKDIWVLSESQETVGVSPKMFAEFIFPYQVDLMQRCGLSYYGCCEPIHKRWHIIQQVNNLRKVSISPWCDEAFMAEALGRDYIYCRKPNPALVSTERFDEEAIRADLRATLVTAAKCNVELVMKDVHTVCGQMHRLKRWVQIAREEARAV